MNNNKYNNPVTEQDYYKKCYYLSRGYILLEIWESEINNCPEDVKNKIKSAVYG